MRALTITSLLGATLALAPHAMADTFSFTPTGGTTIDFTTGTPATYNNTPPLDYVGYTTPGGEAYFFGAGQGAYYDANLGFGPTPFDFRIDVNGSEYLEDGVQLFTGDVSNPTFLPGTYTLVADQKEGNGISGTLVVDGGAASVTPEPSSFLLLGTGALGCFGAMRRRFRVA